MSNDKIADLKAKFVAGAILQEVDYAKLLDMLEETRVATGTSPDTPAGDTGLEIDGTTKTMGVKLDGGGLLEVNPNGLAIPLATRLRLACGLVSDQEAFYGETNGTYVVAVPRAGYTVFHYFQPLGQLTLWVEVHTAPNGNKIPTFYKTYDFKYGPGLTDGLNTKTSISPGHLGLGTEVFVAPLSTVEPILNDPQFLSSVGKIGTYAPWINVELNESL